MWRGNWKKYKNKKLLLLSFQLYCVAREFLERNKRTPSGETKARVHRGSRLSGGFVGVFVKNFGKFGFILSRFRKWEEMRWSQTLKGQIWIFQEQKSPKIRVFLRLNLRKAHETIKSFDSFRSFQKTSTLPTRGQFLWTTTLKILFN